MTANETKFETTIQQRKAAGLLDVPLFEIPDHVPGIYGASRVEEEVEIDGLDSLADRIYGTPWQVAALVASHKGLSAVLVRGAPAQKVYHPDTGTYRTRNVPAQAVANDVRGRLAKGCVAYHYGNAGYDPAAPGEYPWL